MDTTQEQRTLKKSIFATLTIAISGVVVGLSINSQSITFDGIYCSVDAFMTITAYFVSKLIMVGDNKRFQYGYWHFEPLVAAINGTILAFTCLYAFINGVDTLLSGGHEVNFEFASIYTLAASILSIAMFVYIRKESQRLHSEFLYIDSQGWLIGGVLTFALFISFLVGILLAKTGYISLSHYTDPVILIILSALLIQIPLRTLLRAVREIFMIAPVTLDKKVRLVMDQLTAQYHFVSYKTYVAKVGRAVFIEISILTLPDFGEKGVGYLDMIRQEISKRLEEKHLSSWLTITFTAKKEWL